MMNCSILDFGARVTDVLQTEHIQAAIDACFLAGGGTVTIPEGVLVIADSAFEKCTELESVNVPYSLAHIGNCAFSECPKLKITTPVGKRIVSFNGRYAIKNID